MIQQAVVKPAKVNADALRAMLRARFGGDEWALFFEVRNATGASRQVRSADALAMNLWPSRGLEIHGFELKCSRKDLFLELRTPAKSDEVQRYCDRWWLVIAERGLVKAGELPPTWGLLAPRGNALRVEKEAPKLKAAAMDRGFLASLLRNAVEHTTDRREVEALVRQRVETLRETDRKIQERHVDRHDEMLRKSVEDFEGASGVKISDYNGANIGAAVRAVLDGRTDVVVRRARHIAQQMSDFAGRLVETCNAFDGEERKGGA